MPLSLEKKLPIILLFAFFLLAAIGFFAYQSTRSLQDAVKWQKHTQEVLLKLDEMLLAVTDSETGTRGFIVTGNDSFLAPYNSGRPKAQQSLEDLKALLFDNQSQRENLTQLVQLIDEKNIRLENGIQMRRNEGLLATVNSSSKGEGERIMGQIRATVQKMKDEELGLLRFREENLQSTLNANFWMMLVSSFAGIGTLALAYFVVFRETRKRELAETNLMTVNQELEKRVEDRTIELENANRELRNRAEEKENLLANEKAARQEAEIATRLRDEFMATVSHELRTPMNAIIGWAKIMQSSKINELNREKAIDTIVRNAETQNRLIEDLMDVSRVISGKLVLETEDVNAAELITNSVETIKPSADEKEIAVDLTIEGETKSKYIAGDPHRLRQVVSNLLTNAVKFSPKGGKIDVGLSSEDGFVEVKIKDNGAGISEDFLPYVFERFRQDRATIEKSGGLGLGLAIVRQLTELHGGSVSVESEGLDKGATFTVKFPASHDKEQIKSALTDS